MNRSIVDFGLLQYFYSIKDISIGGQCVCYGHAKMCMGTDVDGVSCFPVITNVGKLMSLSV